MTCEIFLRRLVLFIADYAGNSLSSGVEVIGKLFEFCFLARRAEALLDKASWVSVRETGV